MTDTQKSTVFQQFQQKFKHLLAGGLAGTISRTTVSPIDRIMILRQTGNQDYKGLSMIQAIMKMYKTEGIKGWFRGNGATVIRIAPFQSIEFFAFEYYRYYFKYSCDSLNMRVSQTQTNLITGACSGMTASTFVYPIDLVRTLLATQTKLDNKQFTGVFGSIFKVYREQGFLSLYRGWGTTMIGIAPYSSLKLTCYQTLKDKYHKKYNSQQIDVVTNLIMGAVSGSFAITIAYPTDLLRKRMQMQLTERTNYTLSQIVIRIYQKTGITGLYSGLLASYVKVLPSTALAFVLNEQFKIILGVVNVN